MVCLPLVTTSNCLLHREPLLVYVPHSTLRWYARGVSKDVFVERSRLDGTGVETNPDPGETSSVTN